MSQPHVAIAIPTFRRPDGLARLVASLNALTFPSGIVPRITLVIIDNDAASTGSPPSLRSRHAIVYRIEPTRGLAAVRNACLDAVPADADVIAFIDDDEYATPIWLDALLAMQRQSGAEIIQGPVRPVYPSPPPEWMREGRYHEVGPFPDGAALTHGASGNVLMDAAVIRRSGIRFHAAFNMSGGEDVDFFDDLLRHGCRIVAAKDAVVFETVPPERMTLRWILARRFRTGHTLGTIARRRGSATTRLLKAGGRFGAGVVRMLAGTATTRTRTVSGLTDMAWGLGTLAAFTFRRFVTDAETK